jgi:hypothetical protein
MFAISLPTRTSAPATPICGTFHMRLDASFAEACAALDELSPPWLFARALRATCKAETELEVTAALHGERVVSLELRLEEGIVAITWVVSIVGRGARATGVSIASSIGSDDAAAMERVLDAWALVGPAVDRQTRRLAHAVRDAADER